MNQMLIGNRLFFGNYRISWWAPTRLCLWRCTTKYSSPYYGLCNISVSYFYLSFACVFLRIHHFLHNVHNILKFGIILGILRIYRASLAMADLNQRRISIKDSKASNHVVRYCGTTRWLSSIENHYNDSEWDKKCLKDASLASNHCCTRKAI